MAQNVRVGLTDLGSAVGLTAPHRRDAASQCAAQQGKIRARRGSYTLPTIIFMSVFGPMHCNQMSRWSSIRTEEPDFLGMKYWRGVNQELRGHWDELGYLSNIASPIYRSRAMRNVLVAFRRGGPEAPYRLRATLGDYASGRLRRAQALYKEECAAVSRAGARGSDEFSPESAARMVNQQWSDIRGATRTPLTRMRALDVLQPDGSRARVSAGAEVLDEMRNHGMRQQGPSPAHIALSAAFVNAFVPQWPELRGTDGGAWDFARELTFAEFRATIGRMADKACGRDGMQLGFLLMCSTEMLHTFWKLLIECARLGTFPDAWSSGRSRARAPILLLRSASTS